MAPINVAWLFIWGLVFLLEGLAYHNKVKGDLISENVWKIRGTTLGRYLLWPAMTWLWYHFLMASPGLGFGTGDMIAITVGLLGALIWGRLSD